MMKNDSTETPIKDLIVICKDAFEGNQNYLWMGSGKKIYYPVVIKNKSYVITIKKVPLFSPSDVGYIVKLNWVNNIPLIDTNPVKLKQSVLCKTITFDNDFNLWKEVDKIFNGVKERIHLKKLKEAEQREQDALSWIKERARELKKSKGGR